MSVVFAGSVLPAVMAAAVILTVAGEQTAAGLVIVRFGVVFTTKVIVATVKTLLSALLVIFA